MIGKNRLHNRNIDLFMQIKMVTTMLAFVSSYWFVTLPGVFTGLYLLRRFMKMQEEKSTKRRVPVEVRRERRERRQR